jgi:hypothetical protein
MSAKGGMGGSGVDDVRGVNAGRSARGCRRLLRATSTASVTADDGLTPAQLNAAFELRERHVARPPNASRNT